MTSPLARCTLSIAVAALLSPALGCGEVASDQHDHDERYLQLDDLSAEQAHDLRSGANADKLHSHAMLPLSAMTVEQAKALTGGGNADALHTHALAPQVNPWVECGVITDFEGCSLKGHSPLAYEYGIAYLTSEPAVVTCSMWNDGYRIYNRVPMFVNADNADSMEWGGFMFHTGTRAPDDNELCGVNWRHKYWRLGLDANTGIQTIKTFFTSGCFGAENTTGVKQQKVYCRKL